MKENLILAFKKKLSQIENYNDIIIKNKPIKNKHRGDLVRYIIKFDKFKLILKAKMRKLKYKSIEVDLSFDEWDKLTNLVLYKIKPLQENINNKDYEEILQIINS